MLALLSGLLAQAGKVAAKKGPPREKDFWYYADTINDYLNNPDFDAATKSPVFWAVSVGVMIVALFRGWKLVLIGYPLAIVMWGIVDRYVLKSTAEGAGDSNIIVFAALTAGVAGLGIYFFLIRD